MTSNAKVEQETHHGRKQRRLQRGDRLWRNAPGPQRAWMQHTPRRRGQKWTTDQQQPWWSQLEWTSAQMKTTWMRGGQTGNTEASRSVAWKQHREKYCCYEPHGKQRGHEKYGPDPRRP